MKAKLMVLVTTLFLALSSVTSYAEEYHYIFYLPCGEIVYFDYFREMEEWEIRAWAQRFAEVLCEEEVEEEPIPEQP